MVPATQRPGFLVQGDKSVDFPHEEVILGATPASLRETLDRICFVLTDDHHSVMPAALCYQINASCKPDEDLQSGANYAAGAAVVQANFETWRRSTTDQLGFAASARSKNALVIAELTFLAKGYQLRAASGSIELFAEGTAPRSGGRIANWMRSGFDMGTVEANPERTRPIAHQMYPPTPVVFTTGVADAGDYYIVASGEVDLACRITHIPKALFA
jgi:hypothetical protein